MDTDTVQRYIQLTAAKLHDDDRRYKKSRFKLRVVSNNVLKL